VIVLDTHAWVWWAAGSKNLGSRARRRIRSSERVLVPAISTWEVAMLVQKGRLEFDRPLLSSIRQALADSHVELVPLTPEIAVRAAGLGANFPGDPVDRLIVATALESRSPLATKDERLRRWEGVETFW
jgi:PIN domain nuclease of toxin-antitoxin system